MVNAGTRLSEHVISQQEGVLQRRVVANNVQQPAHAIHDITWPKRGGNVGQGCHVDVRTQIFSIQSRSESVVEIMASGLQTDPSLAGGWSSSVPDLIHTGEGTVATSGASDAAKKNSPQRIASAR